MSGLGQRFVNAGYTVPKPLIEVHGKPIIAYVLDLFPGESDITFICRDDHLESTNMFSTLESLCPEAKILDIPGHKKGPVYAVSQVYEEIGDAEDVIVSYCDFFQNWDYQNFRKEISTRLPAGAIPCYSGFHPHLLHPENFYAGCRVDENMNLLEIREKHSFESDKMNGLHSSGLYYFSSTQVMRKYFDMAMAQNYSLNGEFYVSMIYELMIRDGMDVYVYDGIKHFCQWGTPKDFEEYLMWSSVFENEKR